MASQGGKAYSSCEFYEVASLRIYLSALVAVIDFTLCRLCSIAYRKVAMASQEAKQCLLIYSCCEFYEVASYSLSS